MRGCATRLWLSLLLASAACGPTTPSGWTLNWTRNGDEEAYSPFDTVNGDVLTARTIRLEKIPNRPWEVTLNRFVYDSVAQEQLENSFTTWTANVSGTQERLRIRIDATDDEPLDHTDGTCVRAEWPEYDAEPDAVAIYWCTGVWAEESIWLALGVRDDA